MRNPWPGQQAEVVNGSSGAAVVAATTAATLSVPVTAGSTYLVEQPATPTTSLPFAQVTGTAGPVLPARWATSPSVWAATPCPPATR